jgi:hypothetical protein
MLLPLNTPVGSDFIKDFPNQHAENMNLIDDYARACLTSDALGAYTPLLTATTTNPQIGTGGTAVLRGFYYEIFDQIHIWGEFRFGTGGGVSGGTGNYGISLPFPALNTTGIGANLGLQPVIGAASLWDDSTPANRQPATVHLRSTTEIGFSVKLNSGAGQREVSNNVPYAVAVSDGMSWYAYYQRMPS